MQFLFYIPAFFIAAYIALCDFKERAITVFSLLLFGVCMIAFSLTENKFSDFSRFGLVNAGFVSVLLLILTIVYSIKHRHLFRIWDTYLGTGDIVLFYLLAFSMESLNFILFFALSMFVGILFHVLLRCFKTPHCNEIPLASALMLTLIVFLTCAFTVDDFGLYNERWIHKILFART